MTKVEKEAFHVATEIKNDCLHLASALKECDQEPEDAVELEGVVEVYGSYDPKFKSVTGSVKFKDGQVTELNAKTESFADQAEQEFRLFQSPFDVSGFFSPQGAAHFDDKGNIVHG